MDQTLYEFRIGEIDMSATFNLSKNNEWETPPDLFQMGCDYFDFEPSIDLCATGFNKKCKIFIKQNALEMDWKRNSWLNPPYQNVKLWIQKAYDEHRKWNVSILALLFAKTDTRIWHDCILGGKAEILFIQGRVHFYKNGKRSKNPAPYPSCFVFWRAKDFG